MRQRLGDREEASAEQVEFVEPPLPAGPQQSPRGIGGCTRGVSLDSLLDAREAGVVVVEELVTRACTLGETGPCAGSSRWSGKRLTRFSELR